MEYRKLIKFGESSFVVSIPKTWMTKNNLKKGDLVYFSENGNNELIIAPQLKEEDKEEKKIIINADNKDIKKITREIISAYLNDFGTVIIEGKNIGKIMPEIREKIQNLMAFEVIEQSNNSIVGKDFLNMKDVSIDNLLRRMDIIAKAMFVDIKELKDKEDINSLEGKEKDMNKICFVILRAVRNSLKNPSYMKKINMSSMEIFQKWNISNQIEVIGDELKKIARMLIRLNLSNKSRKDIMEILEEVEKQYNDTLKSYYTNDQDLAFETSNHQTQILERCNNIITSRIKSPEPKDGTVIIIEKLKNLTEEVNIIARWIYS